MTLILGLISLAFILWMANSYLKADPRKVAAVLKLSGGIAALGFAALMALRGQFAIAVPLGFTGLGLLGWVPFGPAGFGARTQKSPGQTSRVRSAFIEMELDHDSGAMRGRVLAGRLQGASLDDLDVTTLLGLLAEFDADSRALLAAYLDRREPGWREHAQDGATAGQGSGAGRGSRMTEEQAYQVLGVPPGSDAGEIKRAHRALMKKLHPDQGGSTYLAAQINEAKEVLLRSRQ
jgi:hypothetical protein